MKNIVIAAGITLIAASAFALTPLPGTDGNRGNVTTFAPNGTKNVSTTVNSVTTDMRSDTAWTFYGMSTCKYRAMASATKSGTQNTLPAAIFVNRAVNPATPYINMSGCKSGELQRQ